MGHPNGDIFWDNVRKKKRICMFNTHSLNECVDWLIAAAETLLDSDHQAFQLLAVSVDTEAQMCHARLWNSADGTLLWDQTISLRQQNLNHDKLEENDEIRGTARIVAVNKDYAIHCGQVVAMVNEKGADKWVYEHEGMKQSPSILKNMAVHRPTDTKATTQKLGAPTTVNLLLSSPSTDSTTSSCYDVISVDAKTGKTLKTKDQGLCCDQTSQVLFKNNHYICIGEKDLKTFDTDRMEAVSRKLSDLGISSDSTFCRHQQQDPTLVLLEDPRKHMQYLLHHEEEKAAAELESDGDHQASIPTPKSTWTVQKVVKGAVVNHGDLTLYVDAHIDYKSSFSEQESPLRITLGKHGEGKTARVTTSNGIHVDKQHKLSVSFVHAEYLPQRTGDVVLLFVQLSDWSHHLVKIKSQETFKDTLSGDQSKASLTSVVSWTREDGLSNIDDFVAVEAAPAEARLSILPSDMVDETENSEERSSGADITLDEVKEEALLQFFPRLQLQLSYLTNRILRGVKAALGYFQSVSSIQDLLPFSSRQPLDPEAPVNRTLSDPVYGYDTTMITLKRISQGELVISAFRGETGAFLWKRILEISDSSSFPFLRLFSTRTHQVSTAPPQVLLVESHVDISGAPISQLFWINAWSGNFERNETYSWTAAQIVYLPSSVSGPHHSKALMIFHDSPGGDVATIHPSRQETWTQFDRVRESFVVQSFDSESRTIFGLQMGNTESKGEYEPSVVWTYRCPSSDSVSATNVGVYSATDGKFSDKMNSYATGDDSVLLKYSATNLLAAVTAEEHLTSTSTNSSQVTVAILDGVTGRLVYSRKHYNAVGPVHGVFVENWFYYSWRQVNPPLNLFGVLSLYEGALGSKELLPWGLSPRAKMLINPSSSSKGVAIESSHTKHSDPLVFHREYILPRSVATLGVTRTSRGITNRHILVGTRRGEVWSLDQRWLDPRRPDGDPTNEQKLEKLMKYHPHLPLTHTEIQTHEFSIAKLGRIYTIPANLESTSLVFAVGLDIFHCRVSPGSAFDVLNEDFNAPLLLLLTGAMTFITVFVKNMLNSKKLKRSWS